MSNLEQNALDRSEYCTLVARKTPHTPRSAAVPSHAATERRREAAERSRANNEAERQSAEIARAVSEDNRAFAEGRRHALMEAVGATADSLYATSEQMKTVEDMRRALHKLLTAAKPD